MSIYEDMAEERLRKKGYKVLHKGSPDFLAYKINRNGEIIDCIFQEVKRLPDKLSIDQIEYKRILELLGLQYELFIIRDHRKKIETNIIKTNLRDNILSKIPIFNLDWCLDVRNAWCNLMLTVNKIDDINGW